MAGFAAGATTLGTLTAPAEVVPGWGTVLNGGAALVGGLLGALGVSFATGKAQDAVLANVSEGTRQRLGQDDAQRRADETQHPYASFAGDLAPNILTMRPGLGTTRLAPTAGRFARLVATPAGGAAVGAAMGGGIEGARQVVEGRYDPWKLAIATGAGAVTNRPTRLGTALGNVGQAAAVGGLRMTAVPVVRAYRSMADSAADWLAGRAATREARANPDPANMRNVTPGRPLVPVEPPPAAPAARKPVPVPAVPAPAPPRTNLAVALGAAHVAPPPPAPPTSLPASSVVEPQPVAGGPAQAGGGGLRPDPGDLADGEHHITTPAGNKVRARFEVVPAASLQSAEGDLQNRDRSRDTTDLQVQDIVSRFDPARLGPSAETDRGAPIVGPDNVVESGNGRMLALNRVFAEHPEKADAYRQYIESLGHSIEGVENPVLIRRRMTDLTPEQRRQFVIDSNKDAKLEMSPTERARSDADSITPDMLAKYAGGDLNSTANQGFVEHFNSGLTANEMGNMIGGDRRLTTTGKQRIENAIVARAYGKPKLLERMMESANDDIRAITGSLADVAAPWASLRQAAGAGEIPAKYDITDQLTAAAARVSDARKAEVKPRDILAQSDAFDPIHPVEAELVRSFYNGEMTRAASRKAVTQFLHDYVAAAHSQTTTEGLFGAEEPREPVAIIRDLLDQRDKPNGTAMLDAPLKERLTNDPERAPQGHEEGDDGRHAQGEEETLPASREGGRRGGGGRSVIEAREGDAGGGLREAEGAGHGEVGEVDGAPAYAAGIASTPGKVGGYDPKFATASFTNRTSIFTSAAAAVGMDFDKFNLLPAPQQVAKLQQAIQRKYGVPVTVDRGMQERFAIDQMLDAYQNLQGMAHALALPEGAINLGGTLKLHLQKGGNFLGVFYPGKGMIALPKRSNSFAHEWGHALDYFLLNHMPDAEGRGLSGAVRKEGSSVLDDPKTVSDAFVGLLNAMFFDKAGMATKILALEAKIAATKSAKVRAQAQGELERLRAGNSQARDISTAFHKNAKAFDGKGDYWSSPTEMMARSFEAFVSYAVEAQGLTTELIGKGDAAYLSNAEERFAKTFPKGEERALIFAAYEKLFHAIGREALLGKGAEAGRPDGQDTARRPSDYARTPQVQRERNVIKREVAAIRNHLQQRAKEKASRPVDAKSMRQKIVDLNGVTTMSIAGNLRMIQARSGSPALQTMIDLLTKQDGLGDRTVARTFGEDVHLRSKSVLNKLANILEANGVDHRSADEDMLLRDLLTGSRADGPDNYVRAASSIRHLLDEEFYQNQAAGIDLGYTRSGYLARVLDMPKVHGDNHGFLRDASEVYGLVFDRDFGTDAGDLMARDDGLANLMKESRRLAKGTPELDAVKKLLKQIQALEKAKKSSDDPDAIDAKLAPLHQDLEQAVGELMDVVKPLWARERAEAWLGKINTAAGAERNASAPDSKYTKHRGLPPEADKILEKFYLSDPVESVVNYVNASARRTAYAKRFGPKGEKRQELFEQMAAEGVSPPDQRVVEQMLDVVTGRAVSTLPDVAQQAAAAVNALGVMALLPRAVISSLAEPFTAGLVTGDLRDGFRIMGNMIGSVIGSADGKQRFELARALGIISGAQSSHIMEARYGQTYADTTRWDRYVSKMFRATGLVALTNAQKTATVGVGHAFLDNLAQTALGLSSGRTPRQVRDAKALMAELGIRDPDAFASQLVSMDRMPNVDELDTPFGEDYATAQLRFSTMVVQEPTAVDRPLLSHNPVGRVIYGITGFSYGYWRNIVKRNGMLLASKAKGTGGREGDPIHAALYGSGAVAAAALAFFVGLTVSVAREELLNPKRVADLKAKGTYESTMAELGFTRTFSFGIGDTVLNTWSGLKYQRDWSNIFIGPGLGFMVQNGQKMATPLVANSRKTNTAEYGAVQGAYSAASPFLAFGLARLPGGPLIDVATGVSMAYVTSPTARDLVASTVVGAKNGSIGPDGKKVKSGPTAYDRALDGMFGTVERKRAGALAAP